MLRLRRGAGLAVNLAPYLGTRRIPLASLSAGRRLNSTDSTPTDDAQPKTEDSGSQSAEQLFDKLASSRKRLQEKIKALEIELQEKTAQEQIFQEQNVPEQNVQEQNAQQQDDREENAPAKSENLEVEAEGSDSNEFNETLDVVKKVYGVSDEKKETRKEKKKKRKQEAAAAAAKSTAKKQKKSKKLQTTIKAKNAKSESNESSTPKTEKWTTLREKFTQLSTKRSASKTADSKSEPLDEELALVTEGDETKAPKAKGKKKKKTPGPEPDVKSMTPRKLLFKAVEEDETLDVPKLTYGLDRVLFNSGVYTLQDRRSMVYNFDPYLASIMPVEQFDFNALKQYITSSKDSRLNSLSAKYGTKYCGSTSSLTSMLSHFHFLLSAWRKPNFEQLSRSFEVEYQSFTALTRGPAAAFARLNDGVYAIDADKEFDTANILSMLGKSMEKLLTLEKDDFEKYRRDRSHQISEEERNADEAFHYTTFGDFMLRSQLDAYDPRLPGTGMFDLKTRACVSIRMDVGDYEKGVGYEIRDRFGQWDSFEREYYDMIRSAFLKYSLQVRMGRMDGIFVAFHNTQRIFGFQYVSLEEMDLALHGTTDRRLGDEEFKASLALLNEALDIATKRYPNQSLRLHVETRPTNPPLTYVFAEPVTDEYIAATQAKGQKSVEKFETEILGLTRREVEAKSDELNEEIAEVEEVERQQLEDSEEIHNEHPTQELLIENTWSDLMEKVDETIENESRGIGSVRLAVQQALKESGLAEGKTEEELESYLNALMDALTAELSDKEPANEQAEEVDEKDDGPESFDASAADTAPEDARLEEEGDGERQVYEPYETPVFGADGGQVSQLVETDVQNEIANASENEHEHEIEHETENENENENETENENENENENARPQPDSSLKDLILKVAEGVDNKSSSLRHFERVLSELAAQSRGIEPQAEDDGDRAQPNESELDTALASDTEADATSELTSEGAVATTKEKELLGMYFTVRNKVNGEVVPRPDMTKGKFVWDIEYTVTEMPNEKAWRIYSQLKNRRKAVLDTDPEIRSRQWHKMWGGGLAKRSKEGQKWREMMQKAEEGKSVYGAWDHAPISRNGE